MKKTGADGLKTAALALLLRDGSSPGVEAASMATYSRSVGPDVLALNSVMAAVITSSKLPTGLFCHRYPRASQPALASGF